MRRQSIRDSTGRKQDDLEESHSFGPDQEVVVANTSVYKGMYIAVGPFAGSRTEVWGNQAPQLPERFMTHIF